MIEAYDVLVDVRLRHDGTTTITFVVRTAASPTPTPRPAPGPDVAGRSLDDDPFDLIDAQALDEDTIAVDAPPDETYAALHEAAGRIGDIAYVDRQLGILETIVRFDGGPSCSVVMTLQGRGRTTEVFSTMESIEAAPAPPIGPVIDALVAELRPRERGADRPPRLGTPGDDGHPLWWRRAASYRPWKRSPCGRRPCSTLSGGTEQRWRGAGPCAISGPRGCSTRSSLHREFDDLFAGLVEDDGLTRFRERVARIWRSYDPLIHDYIFSLPDSTPRTSGSRASRRPTSPSGTGC